MGSKYSKLPDGSKLPGAGDVWDYIMEAISKAFGRAKLSYRVLGRYEHDLRLRPRERLPTRTTPIPILDLLRKI